MEETAIPLDNGADHSKEQLLIPLAVPTKQDPQEAIGAKVKDLTEQLRENREAQKKLISLEVPVTDNKTCP